jgi:hypothetical protein
MKDITDTDLLQNSSMTHEDYKGKYNLESKMPVNRKERRKQEKKPKLSKALSYNMNKSSLQIFNGGFKD